MKKIKIWIIFFYIIVDDRWLQQNRMETALSGICRIPLKAVKSMCRQ